MTNASEIFFEIHKGLPQEGPGNDAATLKALSCAKGLPPNAKILDIGCGPGRQTLALAMATEGTIVAVDTHQPYLDQLSVSAKAKGLAHRITVLNRSMTDLGFADGSFDLIWSEGAAYIMGFAEAFHAWKPLLRNQGHLALTECTWLTPKPSAEIREYFDQGYPAMTTVMGNLDLIKKADFVAVDYFPLSREAWWQYYDPIKIKAAELRHTYSGDPDALNVIEGEEHEIRLFERYGDEYGYVFYVLWKLR